jgi:predicted CoA-binding protein
VSAGDDVDGGYAPSDAELRSILGDARTIAVVGLSARPDRYSNEVAAFLQSRGYRIVPVNPNVSVVLGEPAYPSLNDVPQDVRVDVVDVFRRAENTPAVAEQAVARGARVLWLQDGIVNDDARRIAEEGGLTVIMGVCIKRTARRLERTSAGGGPDPIEGRPGGSDARGG